MDVHIAARTFELAYYVKVKGVSLENGLLHVDPRARDSGGDEAFRCMTSSCTSKISVRSRS